QVSSTRSERPRARLWWVPSRTTGHRLRRDCLSDRDRHHRGVVEQVTAAAKRRNGPFHGGEHLFGAPARRGGDGGLEPIGAEHVAGLVLHFDAAIGIEEQQIARGQLYL